MMAQALLTAATVAAGATRKPHILFIVVDDHGHSDCGFTGRSYIETPTIDYFASSGVVFDSMYVQKVCSPTRTALLTGRMPHRMGMQTPFCGGAPEGLNLNETLLPQYLSKVNYSTHAVGKWSCFCITTLNLHKFKREDYLPRVDIEHT